METFKGTGKGDLDVGGGDPVLVVTQFLLDHVLGKLFILRSLLLEPVVKLFTGQFLDQVDRDDPALAVVRGPLNRDVVGQRGGELAQGRDVHRLRRTLGLHVGLVGRDGVGQGTHLVIDLDTNTWRKFVRLLFGRVELTESELDLVKMTNLGGHPDISVGGDVISLVQGQGERE